MYLNNFILNGRGHGEVASALQEVSFDTGLMRPYYDSHGNNCVTVNTGRTRFDEKLNRQVPIFEKRLVRDYINNGITINGPTSLRKDDWIRLDTAVLTAARQRLRAWADLAQASSFGGFNAMSKMILEHETMSDGGEALVDMDALSDSRHDAPRFQLEGLPLPITHSGFWFSSRRLAISRNSGTPLDVTQAEHAARRVAEKIEKTLIGIDTGILYGDASQYSRNPQVYGYLNFPRRLTYNGLTIPTGSNPEVIVGDVLGMIDAMTAQQFYGPFMIYHSTDWDRYLDNDYARLGGNNANMTLRDRLRKIDGIQDVRRLDYLDANSNPFTFIMVQMTSEVAQAVDGMGITTLQWESLGGMKLNFKVMCIQVPRLRADFYGRCGIQIAVAS